MENVKVFKDTLHIKVPHEDLEKTGDIITDVVVYLANTCDIVLLDSGTAGNFDMIYDFSCNGGEYVTRLTGRDLVKLHAGKTVICDKIYDYKWED